MNLKEAQDTFAVRLYRWSLRDFLREINEGCPLLSLVGLNDRLVAAFVSWVKAMSQADREIVAQALPRLAHEHATALLGEALSEKERHFWNMKSHREKELRMHELPPLTTGDQSLPGFRPVNPDRCLDALVSCLAPVLGRVSRRKSAVFATRKVGDWKIITEFTFRRGDRELFFEYQFVRKDGTRFIGLGGPFPRTLFRFYGVSTTMVRVPSEADSSPMAGVIATLAEYFVSQADPLFVGLGMDD